MTEARFVRLRTKLLTGEKVSAAELREMLAYDPNLERYLTAEQSVGGRRKQRLSAAERRRRSIQARINFGHVRTFRGTTGRKFPISPRKSTPRGPAELSFEELHEGASKISKNPFDILGTFKFPK